MKMATYHKRIREGWMARFEEFAIQAQPSLAGRIDWDTAEYLFNTGITPDAAAARLYPDAAAARVATAATTLRHGDTIVITADDTYGTGLTFRAGIRRDGRYVWQDAGFDTAHDALDRALDMVRTA